MRFIQHCLLVGFIVFGVYNLVTYWNSGKTLKLVLFGFSTLVFTYLLVIAIVRASKRK